MKRKFIMKGEYEMKSNKYRLFMCLAVLAFTVSISAVPAKPGMWRTLQLKKGKEVKAQLVGDEWFHFYADSLGNAYVEKKNQIYKKVSKKKLEKMRRKSQERRKKTQH